jgi:hypothetical protein
MEWEAFIQTQGRANELQTRGEPAGGTTVVDSTRGRARTSALEFETVVKRVKSRVKSAQVESFNVNLTEI